MFAPPFFNMNVEDITVDHDIPQLSHDIDQGFLPMTESTTETGEMDQNETSHAIQSVTEASIITTYDENVLKTQQKDADDSVCQMIKQLISSMQNPVKIQTKISQATVGTQAGFSCFLCDLSFWSSSGLMRHNKIKHAFFPLKCVHCNVGFYRLCGLTKHLNIAHGIVVKKTKIKK